jgi:hypothetical protein
METAQKIWETDEERILRERLPSCPSCGAMSGVKCISTSRSVARKRAAAKWFEYAVHVERKYLIED